MVTIILDDNSLIKLKTILDHNLRSVVMPLRGGYDRGRRRHVWDQEERT